MCYFNCTRPILISCFSLLLHWMRTQPGRLPQEAIDMFDIAICGTSFYGGRDWFVPNPKLSFACQTDLNSTASNDITLKFMANLYTQANRCLLDVANEMGLYRLMLDNGHRPIVASGLLVSAIIHFRGKPPLPVFPFYISSC